MKRSLLLYTALCASLFCPAISSGQGNPAQPRKSQPTTVWWDAATGKKTTQSTQAERAMAEDMEVFSTIVHENIQSVFRQSATSMLIGVNAEDPHSNNTLGELFKPTAISEPLFDRLPGGGVIVQMRIPALRSSRPKAHAEQEAAVSRWEQTRDRLRGKSKRNSWQGKRCEDCHAGHADHPLTQRDYYQLYGYFHGVDGFNFRGADALGYWLGNSVPRPTQSAIIQTTIDSLAEHGRHIRGLRPDERVTISLSSWRGEPRNTVSKPAQQPQQQAAPAETGEKEEAGSGEEASQQGDNSNSKASSDEASSGEAASASMNEIDKYILERLKKASLDPNVDRQTLIRRVYFDLVGLPPTEKEVQEFVADGSADAYSRFIDRVLSQRNDPYQTFVSEQIVATQSRLPSRTRISVSATGKQLADVASGKLTRLDFARHVEVQVFSP